MNRRLRAGITMCGLVALLAAVGCSGSARNRKPSDDRPGTPTPAALTATPSTVMPLGDSITDGLVVPGGYRTDLSSMLIAAGRPVHFVGSQSGGPPQLEEQAHEGHSGWTIGQLDAQVKSWLTAYRPASVLLQAGTNDLVKNIRPGLAPRRLGKLIDDITATLPNARLYVATITPITGPRLESRVHRFNATVTTLVNARHRLNGNIQLVDMHSALTRADLSPDGTHPDAAGYAKMAVRWFEALAGAPLQEWHAADPAIGVVNDGERLPSSSTVSGTKVGYLDNPDSYLQLKVTAPAAGSYNLFVRAANGASTPCSQLLAVNGRDQGQLDYPAYGWDKWAIVGTHVALAAGPNTLRFSHRSCGVELDSIGLSPVS